MAGLQESKKRNMEERKERINLNIIRTLLLSVRSTTIICLTIGPVESVKCNYIPDILHILGHPFHRHKTNVLRGISTSEYRDFYLPTGKHKPWH